MVLVVVVEETGSKTGFAELHWLWLSLQKRGKIFFQVHC